MKKWSKLFWDIDEMNGLDSLFQIYKKETLASPSLSLSDLDSLFSSSVISLHDSQFLFPESLSASSPPQLLLIRPSLVFVIHHSVSLALQLYRI
jgi:hypothetical protein